MVVPYRSALRLFFIHPSGLLSGVGEFSLRYLRTRSVLVYTRSKDISTQVSLLDPFWTGYLVSEIAVAKVIEGGNHPRIQPQTPDELFNLHLVDHMGYYQRDDEKLLSQQLDVAYHLRPRSRNGAIRAAYCPHDSIQ